MIIVQAPLNATILMDQHILLTITAQREYTSGAATTIIIQLPEGNDRALSSFVCDLLNNLLLLVTFILDYEIALI